MKLLPSRPVALAATALAGAAVFLVMFPADSLHARLRVEDGRKVINEETGAEVRDVTAYCLSCHDGSIGPLIAFRKPENVGTEIFEHRPLMHRVGMTYPAGRSGFHSGGPTASEIVLVNGLVSCISCHDGGEADRRLVMSNRGSRLCLSCHDK